MTQYTALLDANVLYPAPMRDLLLQLAVTDLFRARWTADIHREWIEALLRNEPGRDRAALERTRDLMDRATRDCLVEGYHALIPALELPDADDRHVLAAAIIGRCDVIVTQNLADFPAEALVPFGIEAQHPDEFLLNHLHLSPGLFCASVRKVRARLRNPPYSVDDYLGTLTQIGLVATAAELGGFAELL
ncbi:PIN domain-containing protein [Paenirhodobacter populi]|uniref:PIN domain-containing protein n=1 Tax=Paenirhodobacter populi TaxID=2306993 RepID=A0A443IIZ6_9RHOB|nr:PIN domain-containing protein [Sinirhodobacter populi]RWR04396.1 PIN domain-containing protein [Sinirhodobacter populi]